MKCLTCHGLITNGNCGCSTGTQGAASVNIDTMLRDRDAEIARLRAEVERLRDYERIHGVRSNEIGRLKAEVERLRDGFDVQVEAITRRDRAIAAGPAALHYRSCDCCSIVEAAQDAAMKEKP